MSPKRRPTNFVSNGQRPSWGTIRRYVLSTDPVCPCGAPATEVDHVWPLYYGGEDHADNLQGLCGPCNRAKGNKVQPVGATEEQLSQAITACIGRALSALNDADRFLDPIRNRALLRFEPANAEDAASVFRTALSQMDIVREEVQRRIDEMTPEVAELRPPMNVLSILDAFFPGASDGSAFAGATD